MDPIGCSGSYGQTFGGGHDLYICSQGSLSSQNSPNLDHSYHNDMGFVAVRVLTGTRNFTVREIEVFEMSEENRIDSKHLGDL
jgi:hypothetical protein